MELRLSCIKPSTDELVQERRNSSALTMELCLSCTKPLTWASCYFQSLQTWLFNCLFSSQYLGCWWPGDARSQGISNHDIDTSWQQRTHKNSPFLAICEGNPLVTDGFSPQMDINAEIIMSWCHLENLYISFILFTLLHKYIILKLSSDFHYLLQIWTYTYCKTEMSSFCLKFELHQKFWFRKCSMQPVMKMLSICHCLFSVWMV